MKRSTLIAIAALSGAIILVPTVASASNGGAWLLGRSNTETSTTTVTDNYGTPLSLNSKSGYAPLKVNRSTKVTNLNADYVDGYSATAFAMRIAKSGTVYHDGYTDGAGAKCPAGTIVTGGGGFDPLGYPVGYSGPDWNVNTGAIIPNSWIVMDPGFGPMVSFATCVQMSGASVPGALTNIASINTAAPAAAAAQGLTAQGGVIPDALNQMRLDAKNNTKVAK